MDVSRKRILFLSSCVRGGGAGWSLYYLLKYLDRSRIEPWVAVPDAGIFAERFAQLGVHITTLNSLPERTSQLRFREHTLWTRALSTTLNLADTARSVPEIVRLIRSKGIDLVYCNNMMVKSVGAAAAQCAGVPCVLHVRNLHERFWEALFYPGIARLPCIRRVIANSEASALPFRRFVDKKVTVIHNGIDLEEYAPDLVPRGALRAELGVQAQDILVGFTGNLIPRKGLDVLIRAAAKLMPERPRLHFVALGRTPIGSAVDHKHVYETLARELGIADRFRFLGFRSDVRPLVADLDVLALPSRQEPFGRSIIEAMALGTPVVASRVGGIPEIITHGQTGLLTRPDDVADLARALGSLVDSPEQRKALREAGLAEVRRRFDARAVSRRIEDLLL